MRTWALVLDPDPTGSLPLFLRIARAVAEDVRRGRLRPGDPLPGSRTLAEHLGVHRNTVLAAWRELTAQGWITSRRARGTYVSDALPDAKPRRFAPRVPPRAGVPQRLGFELRAGPERIPVAAPPSGALVLAGALPDLRLVPTTALARAYRRALQRRAGGVLAYGDPRGHAGLRAALAAMLAATRGLAIRADDLMVTRGSQMALDLVTRALVAPGDVVAVESLGYRPAWEALRLAGARLVPIPLDGDGLDVAALEAVARREPLRAVYVTPHHQYPTTVTLAASRRLRLLELAAVHRFAILEDDYDHEFHYGARPVLPLASADPAGVVVYLGTLSKLLAPGLRIGFVVAPGALLERLATLRTLVDRQGDLAVEAAVAELMEEGELQRHARRARRAYQARRDVLAAALRDELAAAFDFELPAGGMALWVRVAAGIDAERWAERARDRGVIVHTGRRFAFDGRPRPNFRLGFAALDERELREAVRRLRDARGRARVAGGA